jgi:hypothetical protein
MRRTTYGNVKSHPRFSGDAVRYWTRIIGFALSTLMGGLPVFANDASSNSAVKLPIIDGADRIFVPIAAEKELSHAWVGQITQGSQGFLWFATRDSLVRYDGPPRTRIG